MVFNMKLFDITFMKSHLCCCFPCKPAWFISILGGFWGLLVLVGPWCGVRNRDLTVPGCSCADKGVGVSRSVRVLYSVQGAVEPSLGWFGGLFPGSAVSSGRAGRLSQTGHFSAPLGLEKTQRQFSTTFDAGNQQKPGAGTGGTPELGDVWMR